MTEVYLDHSAAPSHGQGSVAIPPTNEKIIQQNLTLPPSILFTSTSEVPVIQIKILHQLKTVALNNQ